MDKFVIGIVGRMGSGKGTAANILADMVREKGKKVSRMTFSDLLKVILEDFNIEPTRGNMQGLALFMIDRNSSALSDAMEKAIRRSDAEVVVIDGIRRTPEYEMIRSFPKHAIFSVTASPKTRYTRLSQRADKPEEVGMTWEEFLHSEKRPTELEIDSLVSKADHEIWNETNLEELRAQLEKVLSSLER